jgi:DNA-binding CsgD family transcriptional regulator
VENESPMELVPPLSMVGNATRTSPEMGLSTQECGRALLAWSGVPRERATLVQATVEVRAALEAVAAAAASAAQRACSLSAMLEEAVAALAAAESKRTEKLMPAIELFSRAEALSPREREVLALVAEGRTNKAIAEALFVSPNTVKTHVASLLHKLRADTRVQLAAMATKHAPTPLADTGATIDPCSVASSPPRRYRRPGGHGSNSPSRATSRAVIFP